MSAQDRSRQPIGIPQGGEFAEEVKARSGMTLVGDEDLGDDRVADTGGIDPALVEYVQNRARQVHRSKLGVGGTGSTWDTDDLAQDVYVQLLEKAKREGRTVRITKAFASQVTKNI